MLVSVKDQSRPMQHEHVSASEASTMIGFRRGYVPVSVERFGQMGEFKAMKSGDQS